MSYPLRVYTYEGTFVFPDRQSLDGEILSGLLPGEFRRAAATAPLYGYRNTSFGSVFADGALALTEVQLAGKKKMAVAEFLKGFRDPQTWKAV